MRKILIMHIGVVTLAILIPLFTYAAPPIVTSISPSNGRRGQTLDIFIHGRNLWSVQKVRFDDGTYIKVNRVSPMLGPKGTLRGTRIRVNITIPPYAPLRRYTVLVITRDGSEGKGEDLFTVVGPPRIRSLHPSSCVRGASADIIITGEGFFDGLSIDFGNNIRMSSYRIEPESYQAIVATIHVDPGATLGKRNVTVRTSYGVATGVFTISREIIPIFTRNRPVISSVMPNHGYLGEEYIVSIKGKKFKGVRSVSFGDGIRVSGFRIINENEIKVSITISEAARLGYRDVTVINRYGPTKRKNAFEVVTIQ